MKAFNRPSIWYGKSETESKRKSKSSILPKLIKDGPVILHDSSPAPFFF